jgi:N-acetylmuramoyl-L-alanine amidase
MRSSLRALWFPVCSAGLRTVMTREDDHFVELDDRVRFADPQAPGAILVSIHYALLHQGRPTNMFLGTTDCRKSRIHRGRATSNRVSFVIS